MSSSNTTKRRPSNRRPSYLSQYRAALAACRRDEFDIAAINFAAGNENVDIYLVNGDELIFPLDSQPSFN